MTRFKRLKEWPELLTRLTLDELRQELAYWKQTGPGLKAWWGREPMTNHYGRLHQTLRQLAKIGITREQEKLIVSTRDLWKALPQLNDIGNGQIAAAAEAVLKAPRVR